MSSRQLLRDRLFASLNAYEQQHGNLPGLSTAQHREAFVEQVVDSIRRIDFITTTAGRGISPNRASATSSAFDPVRAAMRHRAAGNIDEACWLLFLSIHTGKHGQDHWRLARELYAGPGAGQEWTWVAVSANVIGFRAWLAAQLAHWEANDSKPRFGNHRKYETLRDTPMGCASIVESYVQWASQLGNHQSLFSATLAAANGDRHEAFDRLYQSMQSVRRFGRLAKIDYLCMLGKLQIAAIEPGHPYLYEATGPLAGARRLFGLGVANYDVTATVLGNALGISMQVVEDSLCNWDKSPDQYRRFRG